MTSKTNKTNKPNAASQKEQAMKFDLSKATQLISGNYTTTSKNPQNLRYEFEFIILDSDSKILTTIWGSDRSRLTKRGRKAIRDTYHTSIRECETLTATKDHKDGQIEQIIVVLPATSTNS